MSRSLKTPALATALTGGLLLAGSAFASTALSQGYMLSAADAPPKADAKAAEMKCGAKGMAEVKCGAAKAGEMKCGADKPGAKAGEMKCGADAMKGGQMSCGADAGKAKAASDKAPPATKMPAGACGGAA